MNIIQPSTGVTIGVTPMTATGYLRGIVQQQRTDASGNSWFSRTFLVAVGSTLLAVEDFSDTPAGLQPVPEGLAKGAVVAVEATARSRKATSKEGRVFYNTNLNLRSITLVAPAPQQPDDAPDWVDGDIIAPNGPAPDAGEETLDA